MSFRPTLEDLAFFERKIKLNLVSLRSAIRNENIRFVKNILSHMLEQIKDVSHEIGNDKFLDSIEEAKKSLK